MRQITCEGSPFEIGVQHGSAARSEIFGGIAFYRKLFLKYTGKEWMTIRPIAHRFALNIQQRWPPYYNEMAGIAQGSGCDLVDIVALNVRTEIAFGLLGGSGRSDGCTTLAWSQGQHRYLGQNWDWMEDQRENTILLTIDAIDKPVIKMVTEGGIIGKIGLNERGVGVCLNAVREQGMDETRLPVHLALRMALEASCARDAAARLESAGIAGSAHILVGDQDSSISLEVTPTSFVRLNPDSLGRLMHTNHLLRGWNDDNRLSKADSFARMERLQQIAGDLAAQREDISFDQFRDIFDDHQGFPVSICRAQEGCSKDATLFNIVMDLSIPIAVVRPGRLCQTQPDYKLYF